MDSRLKLFGALLDYYDIEITPEFKDYLIENGYFTVGGSTRFHHCNEGGLFIHSYEVATQLLHHTECLDLSWSNDMKSPIIVGLFHDLCKCDDYLFIDGKTVRNPEAEEGHGTKSVEILEKFMKINPDEKACILYHMGAYSGNHTWNNLGKNIKVYPNILYTHLADMLSLNTNK